MNLKKILPFLILISNFSPISYTQSLPKLYKEKVNIYQTNFPQEKVYIHHDKDYYVSGETLWFKVYLVDASQHILFTPSQIVHVQLVDLSGIVLKELALKITNGGAAGDIYISPDWEAGSYTLRAYTQYMRNYNDIGIFQKEIPIFTTIERAKFSLATEDEQLSKSDFTVQFFPEGGDLVAGLSSKICFKAIDSNGKGVVINGWVADENNSKITQLVSFPLGFGFFKLKPELHKKYKVHVDYNGQEKTFDLPNILASGYVLQVNNQQKESTILKIKTNLINGLQDAFLIGHIRGQIFCTLENLQEGTIYRLPKDNLPSGVAQLTLFNGVGLAVAERLIFIDADSSSSTKLVTSNNSYSKREKIKLNIELPSIDSFNLANLSVSISDNYIAPLSNSSRNIQSYLLLESDIRGALENPSYYFDRKNAKRKQVLDLLLLTQGWRRFTWQNIIDNTNPSIEYPIENGFTISGVITKKVNKNRPVKADVFFSSIESEEMIYNQVTTKDDGRFAFADLHFMDTTTVLLQASVHKSKKNSKRKNEELGAVGKRNVSILLDTIPSYKLDLDTRFDFLDTDYLIKGQQVADIDFDRLQKMSAENIWEIDFEEVVVRGKKKEVVNPLRTQNILYKRPDHRIHLDSFPSSHHVNIFDFLRGKVPGVEIVGFGFDKAARIRGNFSISLNTNATILLDGMQLQSGRANSIDPQRIAFVDVLKSSSKTAIYGAAGAGGIIALYTREPKEYKRKNFSQNGILNIQHAGYYQAREFYNPVYPSPNEIKRDYRVTLYWNPTILLQDGKKTISLEFFSADRATEYKVRLEGVANSGQIFKEDALFIVE